MLTLKLSLGQGAPYDSGIKGLPRPPSQAASASARETTRVLASDNDGDIKHPKSSVRFPSMARTCGTIVYSARPQPGSLPSCAAMAAETDGPVPDLNTDEEKHGQTFTLGASQVPNPPACSAPFAPSAHAPVPVGVTPPRVLPETRSRST